MPKISFSLDDLNKGCAQLKAKNKFSPGFDKMTPGAAELWLELNGEKLCNQLNGSKYNVMPATGFHIAKADGSYRRLANLTAIDTIIQMVTLDKITQTCEELFSENSFAYRKGRGTGSALLKYCEYAAEFPFAAKIDQKSCFDSIDFGILEKSISRFFFDRKTVKLLMSFAAMPIIEDGTYVERKRGILQGSPLSGTFCNIYLHSLDVELESRNIRFIRYADDIVLFAKTRSEAETQFQYVSDFLKDSLRLNINSGKSYVEASEKIIFLGRRFLRDKSGRIITGVSNQSVSVYYDWYSQRPRNHRNSIDILSDGILRQKDYSAIFDSETSKTDIPLDTLERINIFSNVIFDSRFLELAMKAGVYVNVFGRDYSFLGRFTPSTSFKDSDLVFQQLTAYNEPKQRIELAKEFDLASVHNLRLNIRYYNKQNENDIYSRALSSIDKRFIKMKNCTSYEDLLLIEAQTRGLYYGCFDSFIKNESFRFEKRSKQPPLNEVNSLISFGNVVLYNYIATELYKSALDIRVGFLHATNRREESLNLDIAEIFRPLIVDRVVFSLINRREINLAHFDCVENGGIYLNEEGKRIFLREFYAKLNSTLMIDNNIFTYSMLIQKEIQKLVRRFRKGEKYNAYRQVR